MAFTAGELQNIANAALDFYIKGPAMAQTIQERPLYDRLRRKQKTFSGGKGLIRQNVKGEYSTTLQGYTHTDTVGYVNPANIKQVNFPWFEIHAGINLTLTELKHDGISVVDTNGEDTTEHSERELHVISGLLEDKLDDLAEGWARDFDRMLHQDGTQDAKEVPGLLSIVADNPATGVLAGIDRATTPWWRNRALVNLTASAGPDNSILASATGQTLTKTLRSEVRQLRRYGGKPNFIICGSGFLDALELEVHEKGTYTQQGFVNKGKNDIGMAVISMFGVGDFIYDPGLDDAGREMFCYVLDDRRIQLRPMDGEDMKQHTPSRPHDQYVIYRAMTWTGGLTASQLNCHGVYEAKLS